MTLDELKQRGVTAVRRMEWVYPHQYVQLLVLDDGTYAQTGLLRTLADANALAQPTETEVLVASLGAADDRWEPYPRP
jgi:hypothetical protein